MVGGWLGAGAGLESAMHRCLDRGCRLTVTIRHPPLLGRLSLGAVEAVRAVVETRQQLRESSLRERRREVVVLVLVVLHAVHMGRRCPGGRDELRR